MKHLPLLFILILFTGCTSQPVLQTAPIPSPTPEGASLPEPTPTSAPPTSASPTSTPGEVTQPAATPTAEEPASSPIPEETQPPDALKSEVQIEAADGLLISGTFHSGTGAPPWPGILLLHMVSGDRSQWDELVPRLTGNGYAVLAVDLRGHGATGGQIDWEKAQVDTLAVRNYLAEHEHIQHGNITLVGASIGANLALAAAATDADIKTVVLLSPGLNYFGVTTLEGIRTLRRPAAVPGRKFGGPICC